MLVACSGGPDSVALLGLLATLRHAERLNLAVGHVDHGLRDESSAEAEGVRALAQSLDLEVRIGRLELARGPGLPARAREARRRLLREQANAFGAQVITLGHTATDQAETVLLHLSRGAGLEGMGGMAEVEPWLDEPGAWARPLLELTRAQTRALAHELRLPFVDDPTNRLSEHPRIAVREEILPVLRRFRDGVDRSIAASATRAREANDALKGWVKRELELRRIDHRWSLQGIRELPQGVRTGWIRGICELEGVDLSGLSRRTVEAIDRALLGASGAPRGWDVRPWRRVQIGESWLWVTTRAPTVPT